MLAPGGVLMNSGKGRSFSLWHKDDPVRSWMDARMDAP
jgi:hypothetical protein